MSNNLDNSQIIHTDKIALFHREVIKKYTENIPDKNPPKIVGFLANDDPAAKSYAKWTKKACEADGIQFELKGVDKYDLETQVENANKDNSIHGIMIYYPVFGNMKTFYGVSMDEYLRDSIHPKKDIEGLNSYYSSKLYRNIRFMDSPHNLKKLILPCTPIAVVKILEYLYQYNGPDPLLGKTITIINRSDIVGRPLAAMLANDGAVVYSIDIDSTFIVTKEKKTLSQMTVEESCKRSQIIITGVPVKSYQLPSKYIQPNTTIINVSSFKNVNIEEVLKIPNVRYVPQVGKVTVAMLERNLLRCYDNTNNK